MLVKGKLREGNVRYTTINFKYPDLIIELFEALLDNNHYHKKIFRNKKKIKNQKFKNYLL